MSKPRTPVGWKPQRCCGKGTDPRAGRRHIPVSGPVPRLRRRIGAGVGSTVGEKKVTRESAWRTSDALSRHQVRKSSPAGGLGTKRGQWKGCRVARRAVTAVQLMPGGGGGGCERWCREKNVQGGPHSQGKLCQPPLPCISCPSPSGTCTTTSVIVTGNPNVLHYFHPL